MSNLSSKLQDLIDDINSTEIPPMACEHVEDHPIWPVDNGQGLFYLTVDPRWLAKLLATLKESNTKLEQVEAIVKESAALDERGPNAFKVGQDHLSPAFREVDWRLAFQALAELLTKLDAIFKEENADG